MQVGGTAWCHENASDRSFDSRTHRTRRVSAQNSPAIVLRLPVLSPTWPNRQDGPRHGPFPHRLGLHLHAAKRLRQCAWTEHERLATEIVRLYLSLQYSNLSKVRQIYASECIIQIHSCCLLSSPTRFIMHTSTALLVSCFTALLTKHEEPTYHRHVVLIQRVITTLSLCNMSLLFPSYRMSRAGSTQPILDTALR